MMKPLSVLIVEDSEDDALLMIRVLKKDGYELEYERAETAEAIASHRPYRPALGIDAALAAIEKNSGTLYNEAVVDVCLKLFRAKGYQFDGA